FDKGRQRGRGRIARGQLQYVEPGLRTPGTLLAQPIHDKFHFDASVHGRQYQRVLRGQDRAGICGRMRHGRPLGREGCCTSPSLRAALDSFGFALAGLVLDTVFFAAVFFARALLAAALGAVLALAFLGAFFSAYRSTSGSSSTGQLARVSRYSWRTSAMCSGSVSSVQFSTEIGGNTATSTVPGFIVVEFRAATISALRITMGTIGIPAAIAMRNGPFLNGPTSVVSSRVPSGAITIESPFLARSSTVCSVSTAEVASSRSMNAVS